MESLRRRLRRWGTKPAATWMGLLKHLELALCFTVLMLSIVSYIDEKNIKQKEVSFLLLLFTAVCVFYSCTFIIIYQFVKYNGRTFLSFIHRVDSWFSINLSVFCNIAAVVVIYAKYYYPDIPFLEYTPAFLFFASFTFACDNKLCSEVYEGSIIDVSLSPTGGIELVEYGRQRRTSSPPALPRFDGLDSPENLDQPEDQEQPENLEQPKDMPLLVNIEELVEIGREDLQHPVSQSSESPPEIKAGDEFPQIVPDNSESSHATRRNSAEDVWVRRDSYKEDVISPKSPTLTDFSSPPGISGSDSPSDNAFLCSLERDLSPPKSQAERIRSNIVASQSYSPSPLSDHQQSTSAGLSLFDEEALAVTPLFEFDDSRPKSRSVKIRTNIQASRSFSQSPSSDPQQSTLAGLSLVEEVANLRTPSLSISSSTSEPGKSSWDSHKHPQSTDTLSSRSTWRSHLHPIPTDSLPEANTTSLSDEPKLEVAEVEVRKPSPMSPQSVEAQFHSPSCPGPLYCPPFCDLQIVEEHERVYMPTPISPQIVDAEVHRPISSPTTPPDINPGDLCETRL